MIGPWAGRPTASLFGQLLVLIGLALIAAQAISLVMLFNLPPPAPDFYRVSEIAQTFRGASPTFTERRELEISTKAFAPQQPMDSRMTPVIRAELARALNVPVERVIIASTSRFPFSDKRVFRIVRDRLAREGEREEHFLIAPFAVGVQ